MKGFLRVLRLTSLLKRIQTPSSIRRYPNKIQVMNRQYLPCVHQIAHCRCNMSAVHTKGLVPVLLPSLQHVPKCLPGLRPRPHYAGEIWQLFFPQSGLPSTLIRHENALQAGGIWKHWLCVLVCTKNSLKTELSENDGVLIITWSTPTFKSAVKLFYRWFTVIVSQA